LAASSERGCTVTWLRFPDICLRQSLGTSSRSWSAVSRETLESVHPRLTPGGTALPEELFLRMFAPLAYPTTPGSVSRTALPDLAPHVSDSLVDGSGCGRAHPHANPEFTRLYLRGSGDALQTHMTCPPPFAGVTSANALQGSWSVGSTGTDRSGLVAFHVKHSSRHKRQSCADRAGACERRAARIVSRETEQFWLSAGYELGTRRGPTSRKWGLTGLPRLAAAKLLN
jgi:hypothetical protein